MNDSEAKLPLRDRVPSAPDGARSEPATPDAPPAPLPQWIGTEPPAQDRSTASPAPAANGRPHEAAPVSAEPPPKINWNEVPLVELIDAASQQRAEAETKSKRWHEGLSLLRLLSIGVGIVLVFVFAIELVQRLTNDRPPDARLQQESERLGAALLRQYAAPGQPLAVEAVRAELVAAPGKGRVDYEVVVMLGLREPLYAPADSNGAQPYLQLQRAVADAQQRVLASAALRARPALPPPPVLPPLIAQTHRRGEALVIRVPLEARRHGLRWALTVHPHRRRLLSPPFTGETFDRQPQPNVVFGVPASREELRRLQAEARDFILAINRAAAGGGAP